MCVPWHQSQTAVHSAGFSWRRSWSSQLVLLWAMNRMQRWAATQVQQDAMCLSNATHIGMAARVIATDWPATDSEWKCRVSRKLGAVWGPRIQICPHGRLETWRNQDHDQPMMSHRSCIVQRRLAGPAGREHRRGWELLRSKFNVDWVVGGIQGSYQYDSVWVVRCC